MKKRMGLKFTRRSVGKAALGAAAVAAVTPFGILRAQSSALKVGVLLPKSGPQAFLGQSCQRGIDVAPQLLADLGSSVKLDVMSVDFETNVDLARSRAEKLINDGAHVLVGPFDSGAAVAIAQVAEQRGIPFVINIAAAPQITEQGYKFVFRNFPTAPTLIRNGLSLMKDFFKVTGATPKSAVYMHVNDTFGQASAKGIEAIFPTLEMPFKILDTIAYDPAARDLAVEVAKAKASGAEMVMLTSRLNDAILLVREMVKQRFEPLGIFSPGSPGMYEQQFFDTLGKYSDYCVSNVPWLNPKSEVAQKMVTLFKKQFPTEKLSGHVLNVGFSVEAIMIVADAYARAKSTDGKALADALRATKIEKRVMIGGPIAFDEKGQVTNIASAVVQNRSQEPKVVYPTDLQELKPVFPAPSWNNRG